MTKQSQSLGRQQAYLDSRINKETIFGGQKYYSLSAEDQKSVLARVMPIIRGAVSDDKKMLLTYDHSEEVLRLSIAMMHLNFLKLVLHVQIIWFTRKWYHYLLIGIHQSRMLII